MHFTEKQKGDCLGGGRAQGGGPREDRGWKQMWSKYNAIHVWIKYHNERHCVVHCLEASREASVAAACRLDCGWNRVWSGRGCGGSGRTCSAWIWLVKSDQIQVSLWNILCRFWRGPGEVSKTHLVPSRPQCPVSESGAPRSRDGVCRVGRENCRDSREAWVCLEGQ